MEQFKKQSKLLLLLLCLTAVSLAQNPALFKGGVADGYTSQTRTQAGGEVFTGGNGDGHSLGSYSQPSHNIFAGGIADGHSMGTYEQSSHNIFTGGSGDGWNMGNYVQQSHSIFTGGNGDGYSLGSYLQPSLSIFHGGNGDGWHLSNYVQASTGIYKGGIADGWSGGYRTYEPGPESSITDYFRSRKTGLWNDTSTWESSANNVTWIRATLTPNSSSNTITVRNGHVVTVTENVTTDQTIVQPQAALTVTASTLKVINNGLTLVSADTGTARIGKSTGTIAGNVIVERYIPAHATRAWRLLAVPTVTSQTIHQSWQNNQTPGAVGTVGVGTMITGNNGNSSFDYQTPKPSMLTYNAATNAWEGIAATTAPINTNGGYMLWVRGDRQATPSNSIITPTVLPTLGSLKQGTLPSVIAPANQFTVIGNPYASQIDFRNVTRNGGIDNAFYVWDPMLTGSYGFGAFQTMVWNGVNYEAIPGGGSYGPSDIGNFIESGQAFIVHASAGGTVVLNENSKSDGSRMVFRGSSGNEISKSLLARLYSVEATGDVLADGTMNIFDEGYSNNVDANDALKLTNLGVNFGIVKDGKTLAAERRAGLSSVDTIHYSLANAKKQAYRFEFAAKGLSEQGLSAYLADGYLHTTTPVQLDGQTSVWFSVNDDVASSVDNRFSIVFSRAPVATETAGVSSIAVYPNPVHSGTVKIQLSKMPEGICHVRLINAAGQTVLTKKLNHAQGSSIESVAVGKSRGVYMLVITKPDGSVFTEKVVVD